MFEVCCNIFQQTSKCGCFLQQLYSYPARAFQHLLNFCRQVELMVAGNCQAGCVDFSSVQVLYAGSYFLFVFCGRGGFKIPPVSIEKSHGGGWFCVFMGQAWLVGDRKTETGLPSSAPSVTYINGV